MKLGLKNGEKLTAKQLRKLFIYLKEIGFGYDVKIKPVDKEFNKLSDKSIWSNKGLNKLTVRLFDPNRVLFDGYVAGSTWSREHMLFNQSQHMGRYKWLTLQDPMGEEPYIEPPIPPADIPPTPPPPTPPTPPPPIYPPADKDWYLQYPTSSENNIIILQYPSLTPVPKITHGSLTPVHWVQIDYTDEMIGKWLEVVYAVYIPASKGNNVNDRDYGGGATFPSSSNWDFVKFAEPWHIEDPYSHRLPEFFTYRTGWNVFSCLQKADGPGRAGMYHIIYDGTYNTSIGWRINDWY